MEHTEEDINPEIALQREKQKEYILEQERKIIGEKYDLKARENKEQAKTIEQLQKENKKIREENIRLKQKIEQITNSKGYRIIERMRKVIKKSHKESDDGKEKEDSSCI